MDMSTNDREFDGVPEHIRLYIKLAVAEAVDKVKDEIHTHEKECPAKNKVDKLELRWAYLVGYMVGSGLLGGTAGAVVTKLLGA